MVKSSCTQGSVVYTICVGEINQKGESTMTQYAAYNDGFAKLSSDFGEGLALRYFGQDKFNAVRKLSKGKNKGRASGSVEWKKCIVGGWSKLGSYEGFVERRKNRIVEILIRDSDGIVLEEKRMSASVEPVLTFAQTQEKYPKIKVPKKPRLELCSKCYSVVTEWSLDNPQKKPICKDCS